MNIYILTQEQYDKMNRSISEALGVTYTFMETEPLEIKGKPNGWGGKTKGTTGYKYTEEQRKQVIITYHIGT